MFRVQEKEGDESYNSFRWQLLLRSCTEYLEIKTEKSGHIDPSIHPAKVDFMFSKKIKMLITNYLYESFLLYTEDGEGYSWYNRRLYSGPFRDDERFEIENRGNLNDVTERLSKIDYYYSQRLDWMSSTRIVKTAICGFTFLILTDDEKLYYHYGHVQMCQYLAQMNIKGKITSFGCGQNFFVVATDLGETYTWSLKWYGQMFISPFTIEEPDTVEELSNKTIVKVVCGDGHTLALSDRGKVYAWGRNDNKQSNPDIDFGCITSPEKVNIPNVEQVSDIAVMRNSSFAKSSENGLVYIWGPLVFDKFVCEFAVCEYTNVFDVCNSMTGQSPTTSDRHVHTDGEFNILNNLEAIFDDPWTSDFMIKVETKTIYVHTAILKIRTSQYSFFRSILHSNMIENNQWSVTFNRYSYDMYKAYLKYFYTGKIDFSCVEDLLVLLVMADQYCDENIKRDCIRMIKKEITVSNVFLIFKVATHFSEELEKYCIKFYLKNANDILKTDSFTQLDLHTVIEFSERAANLFPRIFEN